MTEDDWNHLPESVQAEISQLRADLELARGTLLAAHEMQRMVEIVQPVYELAKVWHRERVRQQKIAEAQARAIVDGQRKAVILDASWPNINANLAQAVARAEKAEANGWSGGVILSADG